jgi:hypothetical protein
MKLLSFPEGEEGAEKDQIWRCGVYRGTNGGVQRGFLRKLFHTFSVNNWGFNTFKGKGLRDFAGLLYFILYNVCLFHPNRVTFFLL